MKARLVARTSYYFSIVVCSLLNAGPLTEALQQQTTTIGPASARDAAGIRARVWAARMNPLSINPTNFLVARPLSATAVASPKDRAGQRSLFVDDSAAARTDGIVGCGQLRPLGGGCLELASLVVDEAYRGQGVGAAIVRELLATRVPAGCQGVFLLTLRRTAHFYQRLGFEACGDSSSDRERPSDGVSASNGGVDGISEVFDTNVVPLTLRMEAAVGSVAAAVFAGDSLVIMRHYQR